MGTFGLGHDVVDVAAFAEQLSESGSRMRSLFSVREVRQAADRARLKNDDEAVHLAAKWAGKEAFLKAWCDYLGNAPYPFTLDNFPWPEIEISACSPASDNGPYAVMQERRNARSAQRSALGAGLMPHIHISLSHDGPIASAVVTISVE